MASHMSETAAIPAHPSRTAETAVPSFGSDAPRSPDRLDRDRQNDARKVPDFLWRSAAIAPVSCGYGSRSETDKIYVPAPAGETRSDFPPSSAPHPGSGCFLPSGMSQKVKDKLFKEMITTKGKNGTGLGLYMSYSTIKAHFNGDITFVSEEGKGSTFTITLPM